MLRLRSSSVTRILNAQKCVYQKPSTRFLSSSSGSSPNPVVLFTAVSTLVVGTTVGYARYDEKFRIKLKKNLPTFLGESEFLFGDKKSEKPNFNSTTLPFQKASSSIEESENVEISEAILDEIVEGKDNLASELQVAVECEQNETLISEPANEDTMKVYLLKWLVLVLKMIFAIEDSKEPSAVDESVSLTQDEVSEESSLTELVSQEDTESLSEDDAKEVDADVVEITLTTEQPPESLDDLVAEQSSNDVEKIETETLLEEEISCEVVSNEANDPATEFEKESASCEEIVRELPVDIDENKMLEILDEELADKTATFAILKAFLSRCKSACEVAIESSDAAVSSTDDYVSTIIKYLADKRATSDNQNTYIEALDQTHELKDKFLEKSINLHTIAYKEMTQIETVLQHVTSEPNCPDVVEIQKDLEVLKESLKNSKFIVDNKLDESQSQSKVLVHYLDLIGKPVPAFMETFQQEIASVGKILSVNEQASVISHLQEYLEGLQLAMEEERRNAGQLLQVELEVARKQAADEIAENMMVEMGKKIEEIEALHEIEKTEASLAYEEEIKHQLKRQAAAHVLHLADALKYMQDQIEEEHQKDLGNRLLEQATNFEETVNEIKQKYENKLLKLNEEYLTKMMSAKSRLRGFEAAIDERSVIGEYCRKAQQLSLACDNLLTVMQQSSVHEEDPIIITKELAHVLSNSLTNPSIEVAASTIPFEVTERGLYNEAMIRRSFKKIANLCCKLSLVNEEHNSLGIYALSFLKSALFPSVEEKEPPKSIECGDLDVFNIVSYASYCLQRGDLEQAAKFVNQMNGEPRSVAENWLHEVRLYLETRQAVEAISAISNSIVLGVQNN